jgi:hypothetical protein
LANLDNFYGEISTALNGSYMIAAARTSIQDLTTTAEDLAKKWSVGIYIAKKTL